MELDFKAIGKRIKIARIKKELTQEAVSEKVGVTPQHMSNIETGNSTVSLPTYRLEVRSGVFQRGTGDTGRLQ